MKRVLLMIGFCSLTLLCGCFFFGEPELVMPKGMVIEATNGSGTMKIEAAGKYTRTYSWNGKKKTFRLIPRGWQRCLGSRGAYRPSGDSEMHASLTEGQQHFSSQEEIYPWLSWISFDATTMYTSDGLVIAWQEQLHPTAANYSALSVDVWQIYVNGKKPIGLRGASDQSIKVLQPGATEIIIGKPVVNSARKINGRNYYGKALDFMDECKISPDLVERVLLNGSAKCDSPLYTCYSGLGLRNKELDFFVWLNSNGDVVFVFGR